MLLNSGNTLQVCKEKYYRLAHPENKSVIYRKFIAVKYFLDEFYIEESIISKPLNPLKNRSLANRIIKKWLSSKLGSKLTAKIYLKEREANNEHVTRNITDIVTINHGCV